MSQLYSIKLQEFDLIVIGAGSGLDVANAAYRHGLRVAVIEKDRMATIEAGNFQEFPNLFRRKL